MRHPQNTRKRSDHLRRKWTEEDEEKEERNDYGERRRRAEEDDFYRFKPSVRLQFRNGADIQRLMERRLTSVFGTTETNPEAENADSTLAALSRLSLQHYTIAEQDIIGLPRPDTRQKRILDALEVKLTAP